MGDGQTLELADWMCIGYVLFSSPYAPVEQGVVKSIRQYINRFMKEGNYETLQAYMIAAALAKVAWVLHGGPAD